MNSGVDPLVLTFLDRKSIIVYSTCSKQLYKTYYVKNFVRNVLPLYWLVLRRLPSSPEDVDALAFFVRKTKWFQLKSKLSNEPGIAPMKRDELDRLALDEFRAYVRFLKNRLSSVKKRKRTCFCVCDQRN